MSDRPVRPGSSRPVRPANRPGTTARRSSPPPSPPTISNRATRPARRSTARPTVPAHIDIRQVASSVLVAILVIATLWAERDRQDPVAGYGVLDARGIAVTSTITGVEVGQPAPDFRLQDTDGTAVALDDLAGQPVVVQFWTSWCLDCIDAIPIFQQVANAHPDDVVVLGIAPEETANRVNGALNRAGATYTTLLDTDGTVSDRYGASSVPFTVVIDASGTVVAVHEGRVSTAQIEADLAPLLP